MHYEVSLLNAIIESGEVNECIEQGIDYVFKEHKDIWNFILEFNSEYRNPPSKDVVKQNFKSFDFIKTESPIQYYIDEAKKEAMGRGLRSALYDASQAMKDGIDPAKVLTLLQNDAGTLMRDSGRMKDSNIADYKERADVLRERIDNPDENSILGVPSGIGPIDEIFGGFQPGDFVVVLGWTGTGKSSLTRLFAANAWKAGYSPLIISLEMDKLQEEYRMDTILNAGEVFTNTQLMNGHDVLMEDYEGWAKNMFDGKHPLHLVTAEGIESADQNFVQAKVDQYRPPLAILDYHLLFEDAKNGGTETERAKNLSKDFKRIAVRNRMAVIDVSGVTMDSGHDDRPPELSEVAWSKQLTYDADMVMAIHKPPGSDVFQVITRKTRRCEPFGFYLRWDINSGKWSEFYEYDI